MEEWKVGRLEWPIPEVFITPALHHSITPPFLFIQRREAVFWIKGFLHGFGDLSVTVRAKPERDVSSQGNATQIQLAQRLIQASGLRVGWERG